jgi:hypothetical protein
VQVDCLRRHLFPQACDKRLHFCRFFVINEHCWSPWR